ncbi:MAG: DUF5667 domain-containing protein [Candidatus Pacearchaeota archaeon]
MNKLFSLLIFVLLLLTFVSAESTTEEISAINDEDSVSIANEVTEVENEVETQEAGTDPSSSFYGMDVLFDNLKYRISSDKTRIGLRISNERLKEAINRAENGDLEGLKRAIEAHEQILAKLNEKAFSGDLSAREKILLESAIIAQNNRIDSLMLELEGLAEADVSESLREMKDNNDDVTLQVDGYKEKFVSEFERKEGFAKSKLVTDSLKQRESLKLYAEILPGREKTIVTFKYDFAQKEFGEKQLTSDELLTQLRERIEETALDTKEIIKIETASDEQSLNRDDFLERAKAEELRQVSRSNLAVTGRVTDDSLDSDKSDRVDNSNSLSKSKLIVEIKQDGDKNEYRVNAVFRTVIDSTDETVIIEQTSIWLNGFTLDVLKSIAQEKQKIKEDDSSSELGKTSYSGNIRIDRVNFEIKSLEGSKPNRIIFKIYGENNVEGKMILETSADNELVYEGWLKAEEIGDESDRVSAKILAKLQRNGNILSGPVEATLEDGSNFEGELKLIERFESNTKVKDKEESKELDDDSEETDDSGKDSDDEIESSENNS